ncbi:MAG: heat-inducible transcriptional repressor [Candidatus Saganbacteria bacterium]|uniref:Heat-inducible transcription repressor HrcA n=1 Tax=Candidatus Saganbacteria bacterium TaxID=2575572 RepID=A0A833L0V4_UNCSA|nr:MAG: heat-inducible transcriptional repressor [Candidatus Saganbacteria bacterium]
MIIELSERKKLILQSIISDYVDTAEPVGSFTITNHYIKTISPATIRAEMAELEHIGYITHPHTSAGRIPTDLGYRYYVDNIMETKNISGKEITIIKTGIKEIGRGIENVLKGTAKLISNILGHFAVFSVFKKEHKEIYSSGISNILKQPEFKDIHDARRLVEIIEHEQFLSHILEEYSKRKDFSISIGHENQQKELCDLSLVVAQYNLKGLCPGAIGIIGPTRMEYNRIASILNYISKEADNLI